MKKKNEKKREKSREENSSEEVGKVQIKKKKTENRPKEE